MQGKLIAVEGTDGSGKATQSKLLVKALKNLGHSAVLVSFPRYNSFFGKIIKRYLKGEFGSIEKVPVESAALLYALDRLAFKPELEKMLEQGKIVVCNRYSFSNLAHQGARIKNREEREKFFVWIKKAEFSLPIPEIKIFLDMPVKATMQLMKERVRKEKTRADIHEKNFAYLEKTRMLYLDIVKKEKNWLSVNCISNKQIAPIKKIHSKILSFVDSKL